VQSPKETRANKEQAANPDKRGCRLGISYPGKYVNCNQQKTPLQKQPDYPYG
jgi:hypothetical protein